MSGSETENMRRLEAIVAELPEAERIDIEAWDDHPAFKVSFTVAAGADDERWEIEIISEWVRTSSTLVAPKSLARIVLEQDADAANS